MRSPVVMQAIRTRYLGPTNTRSARMSAQCQGGKTTIPYDDMIGLDANHHQAMLALAELLQWPQSFLAVAGTYNGDTYHCFYQGKQ